MVLALTVVVMLAMAAFAIMMFAVAALAIVVVLAMAALAVVVMVAAAATALVFIEGKILAMEALIELFFGGFAHAHDLNCEVEGLAGEGMVEVHGYRVGTYGFYRSLDHISGGIVHRHHRAGHQKVLAEHSVHLERTLGNIEAVLGIELAVSFGRSHIKFHTGTFLRTFKALLEARNHHVRAVNVIQGCIFA